MARDGSRQAGKAHRFRKRAAFTCGFVLLVATAEARAQWAGERGPVIAAQSAVLLALRDQQRDVARRDEWLAVTAPTAQARPLKLRIGPLAAGLAATLRRWGIPAQEVRDGRRAVAVSASVHLGRDLPDLKLHIGDRAAEPFGAFYASQKGVRWAVVWPIDRFTLRIEGGKDSEFGYIAIAGLHWRHPDKPIAIGLGIPAHMKGTDGEFAAIAQLRIQFRTGLAPR